MIRAAIDAVDQQYLFKINPQLPEVPIDIALRQARFRHLRRNPKARKLLLAVHYLVCLGGRLAGEVPLEILSHWLWGEQRPRNWRRQLSTSILQSKSACIVDGVESMDMNFGSDTAAYAVNTDFLGRLGVMYCDQQEKLTLVARSTFQDAKIHPNKLNVLKKSPAYCDATITTKALKEIVQDRRKERSTRTLGWLRKQRVVNVMFMPLFLGQPAGKRALPSFASLLMSELTKNYTVTNAMIRPFSKGNDLVCRLLDPSVSYAAFAANGRQLPNRGRESNRAGRGYKLETWGTRIGGDASRFLRALRDFSDVLGLVTVCIDPQDRMYILDELLLTHDRLRETLHVRVYTPEGFKERWAQLANWKPFLEDVSTLATPTAPTGPKAGDLALVKALAIRAGVRQTARSLGMDHGNLTKILNGKRVTSPEKMALIRAHLMDERPAAGESCREHFVDVATTVDWALAYHKLGWVPLPVVPGTRKTFIKWKPYQTCIPTEREVRNWFPIGRDANVGILLGPLTGILVVDVDSAEAHDSLVEHLGGEPVAPCVLSGSWSEEQWWKMHFFFKHPVGVLTKSHYMPWHPNLEFRGTNGLAYAPPSISHKTGNCYNWKEGQAIWDLELPDVPSHILEALTARTIRTKAPAVGGRIVSGGYAQWQGLRLFTSTVEFLKGQHVDSDGSWDNRIFAAAVDLRDQGVLRPQAIAWLLDGAGCRTTDDEGIAKGTILSAYSRSPVKHIA